MRNPHPDFYAALVNARERGIVPRKLVSITGRSHTTGELVAPVSFWSENDDEDITVTSGLTGDTSTRLFFGGINLVVSPIPRVASLTIQTVTVTAGQISPAIQTVVRGSNIRQAKVEIWDALLDPASRLLVAPPELVWLGEVDGSPIETPPVGGNGSVKINTKSDAISMLTRKNPAKSSAEEQKRRQGDEWNKYAGAVKNWKPNWGQDD
ncbi:hypothetical protein [Rhizobium sp. NFR03]|uniref:hypothetical protein n=1 Tax=Rhizobium sp. NFR03 TaxID=1566263 RepID=UPI0008C9384D|nr:hypothetical protein [Rhizobium sp. NFR03]SER57541.1 hypothetical protein SAMN03159406_00534 [Rhizobium sp. NFR03]